MLLPRGFAHAASLYWPGRLLWFWLLSPCLVSDSYAEARLTFTQGDREDHRVQPEMALFVPVDQTATPFLVPGSFQCVLEAQLVVDRRQQLRFEMKGSGQAKMSVNGEEILETLGTPSEDLTLAPGLHRLKIAYRSPDQGEAQLRVYWSGEDFLQEPLSASHLKWSETQDVDRLRQARHQLADLNCVACHQSDASILMPEAQWRGPSLNGVGSRLQPAWMARWIADPQSLRASSHMPQIFRGKGAAQNAAHIAAFLAQQRGSVTSSGDGNVKEGGYLFRELNCIGCHQINGENSDRISLLAMGQKYQPGALAAYLLAPEKHHEATAMPNFSLTSQEASDLASFLLSQGESDSESGDLSFGDPVMGKQLIASSGCLQCHDLDGVSSTMKAPPMLNALLSKEGCLDPTREDSAAPRFQQDLSGLHLADAELKKVVESLGRYSPVEFAQRQMESLQCSACHQRHGRPASIGAYEEEVAHLVRPVPAKQDGEAATQPPQHIPSIDHAGQKLNTDWLSALLKGENPEPTRPWLAARMPAWPSRAENLAVGIAHGHGLSPQRDEAPAFTEASVAMGQKLVGVEGFSCNACHAIGDQPALAVFEGAGPNLKLVPSRLRHDYFYQWMHHPQRWITDTIMPRYAENGVSPLKDYADGDATRQFEAMLGSFYELAERQPPGMQPGLIGSYYQVRRDWQRTLNRLNRTRPFLVRVDPWIAFANGEDTFADTKLSDQFMVQWQGSLRVEVAGTYQFFLQSDDGARLKLDDENRLDYMGPHSFAEKTFTIDLEPGLHPFELTYHDIAGGQGCILSWIPPGGSREVIRGAHWLHATSDLQGLSWDQDAWESFKVASSRAPTNQVIDGAGEALDPKYGSLIGTAVRVGNDSLGENIAFRGQVLKLDSQGKAAVVFDTDTMRMAAAWLDGGLRLEGLPFTGGHGAFPNLRTAPLIRNRAAPGWANTQGSFQEPRVTAYPPLGPLPKDWAHYEGLYRHGDKVVLEYTVGSTRVLEHPSLIQGDGGTAISRLLEIQAHDQTLWVAVSDLNDEARAEDAKQWLVSGARIGLVSAPAEASLVQIEGQLCVKLPPSPRAYQAEILIGRQGDVLPSSNGRQAQPLTQWTQGGPIRWPEVLLSHGELASEEAGEAYVLDRLTLPDGNPYGLELRIGGFDFFADSTKAALCTWDGDVWIVSGIDEDLDTLEWKRFASGIHEPLGLKIVDDLIYTVSDDQITRFHDLNQDGEADYYENFNNDWELTSGFHAFLFDLHTDPEGNFLFAFGSPVRGGGRSFERMSAHHGSVLKVSRDGSTMTRYASGLRAPNGIGVSPTGQVTTGDNEGTFVPRCPINWVEPDDFLGVVDSYEHRDAMKTTATVEARRGGRPTQWDPSEEPRPLAWLPKGVDNSGGGQGWVTSDQWGPLQGQMLHGSYGQSSLYLVLKESVQGQMQGGVVKIPLRPTSSVMRMRFSPGDGQLYLSGLKGWQSNAAQSGGFDRVRYTGQPLAMPVGLKTTPSGLRVTFSQALDSESANELSRYSLRASDILWDQAYGSQEYLLGQRDVAPDQKQTGWSTLSLLEARLSADKLSVDLRVQDWRPAHMLELNLDLLTGSGQSIRTRVHHTVHVIPQE